MSSVSSDAEKSQSKLSNRGNKLSGEENPGSIRPKIWNKLGKNTVINQELDENTDFENYEKMFLRKIKYSNSSPIKNDDSSLPFVRFLNEFEAQKSLFSKEGIELEKIFKEENLALRPLSRYTQRALQSRHLEVIVTLLMLKIEQEQEQYRKLMRLAEELCIEGSGQDSLTKMKDIDENSEEDEIGLMFKRDLLALDKVDPEEVLKLKALCHEHLHLKRVYISMLRKIRSGAVYSLFQANNIYQKLHRLDRKLAILRRAEEIDEDEEAKKNKKDNVLDTSEHNNVDDTMHNNVDDTKHSNVDDSKHNGENATRSVSPV